MRKRVRPVVRIYGNFEANTEFPRRFKPSDTGSGVDGQVVFAQSVIVPQTHHSRCAGQYRIDKVCVLRKVQGDPLNRIIPMQTLQEQTRGTDKMSRNAKMPPMAR